MASSKEYLHFILEQLSDLDDISYRSMICLLYTSDGGKTTVGTHAQLMETVPLYRQLYESQTVQKLSLIHIFDAELVEEVRHLRAVLEAEIARMACEKLTPADIDQLWENVALWRCLLYTSMRCLPPFHRSARISATGRTSCSICLLYTSRCV